MVTNDEFGIEEALMTTVHGLIATQAIVDSSVCKIWRGVCAILDGIKIRPGLSYTSSYTDADQCIDDTVPRNSGRLHVLL